MSLIRLLSNPPDFSVIVSETHLINQVEPWAADMNSTNFYFACIFQSERKRI
jgi:hypothetical protein